MNQRQKTNQKQKQNQGSYSNQSPSHFSSHQKHTSKSPILSNSKMVNQPHYQNKHMVSYGQLQIVLQNIQQIRKKANHQIKLISVQNQELKEELKWKAKKIDELSVEISSVLQHKNKSDGQFTFQIQFYEKQNESLSKSVKEYEQKVVSKDRTIIQLEKKMFILQERVMEAGKQVQSWQKKWKWAFDIISEGELRGQQFIWKVKNQYKNGLWTVLQRNKELEAQLQQKRGKISDLQIKITQKKDINTSTNVLVQKSLTEISILNKKLFQLQDQLKKSHEHEYSLQNQLKQIASHLQQYKIKQIGMQKKFQVEKEDLLYKITYLQDQLFKRKTQVNSKLAKGSYDQIIDDICDDTQNYDSLTQRIRYLQKFRNEHYFNIEKIQYLCKMLDQ